MKAARLHFGCGAAAVGPAPPGAPSSPTQAGLPPGLTVTQLEHRVLPLPRAAVVPVIMNIGSNGAEERKRGLLALSSEHQVTRLAKLMK